MLLHGKVKADGSRGTTCMCVYVCVYKCALVLLLHGKVEADGVKGDHLCECMLRMCARVCMLRGLVCSLCVQECIQTKKAPLLIFH